MRTKRLYSSLTCGYSSVVSLVKRLTFERRRRNNGMSRDITARQSAATTVFVWQNALTVCANDTKLSRRLIRVRRLLYTIRTVPESVFPAIVLALRRRFTGPRSAKPVKNGNSFEFAHAILDIIDN